MGTMQQTAKAATMINEAPMNRLSLSDRLKSYKRTPGSLLVMLLVVLSAVATIAALIFLILYILVNGIPEAIVAVCVVTLVTRTLLHIKFVRR